MKKVYWFILDHIRVIAAIMILLIIPDILIDAPFVQIHLGVLFAMIIFVMIGLFLWSDKEYEWNELENDDMDIAKPCSYCKPRPDLPRNAPEGTFTVWDRSIWHKSHGQWECVEIDYCPMCGKYIEEDNFE